MNLSKQETRLVAAEMKGPSPANAVKTEWRGGRSGSDVVLSTIATEGPTPDETQPSDESTCIHAYQSETLLMLGDLIAASARSSMCDRALRTRYR